MRYVTLQLGLMVWGDALFLVRCELGKLQLQRIIVDASGKKASLCLCNVNYQDEATVLPEDALLVAAKEVEDTDLAIQYPVLVFQASQGVGVPPKVASRKRRRSSKDHTELQGPTSNDRLFFCVLHEMEDENNVGLQLLNTLEIPICAGENGDEVGDGDFAMRQVFLTDGPHVLFFERSLQLAKVLTLQRDGAVGFQVWRDRVDVVNGMAGSTSEAFELVSCTYVSETLCSREHLLIHAQLISRSSDDAENHVWSIFELGERRDEATSSMCHYLNWNVKPNQAVPKFEQVTCCCFVSELSEWTFTTSTATLSPWDQTLHPQLSRPDILSSALVITGTTSNTIYAYSNGIRIASYVLPIQPAEMYVCTGYCPLLSFVLKHLMWCMSESSFNQRNVLCVRCNDVNRSFFMLEFSSTLQNVSMELLLCKFGHRFALVFVQNLITDFSRIQKAFNNVGHAHTGYFADTQAFDMLSPQALLLNDVPGICGASTYRIRAKAATSNPVEDGQLVKRSVLIMQKASALDTKFVCHRLRLLEDKQSKHETSSRKRSRNDTKSGSKDACSGSKADTFHYIQRTQKASSRDRRAKHFDEDSESETNMFAASQSQLTKLTGSLSVRLNTGVQELERLQLIVGDKCLLARQLNRLITQQWQKQYKMAIPTTDQTEEDGNFPPGSKSLINMETIVSAALNAPRIAVKDISDLPFSDLKPAQKVSLEIFRVLQYVPSSSLVRAEVVLKNAPNITLNDCFVVITAPQGEPVHGWRCSSSVISEYSTTARFSVELQFMPSFSFLRERKPLAITLWLHWGTSQDHCSDLDWRPSESVLAVASVNIHPDDLVNAVREASLSGDVALSEQDQLLFLSSGPNFESLFRQPSFKMSTVVVSVIRPTFALMHLDRTSRELMLHEMGRMVASLPRDVYAMQNPLQLTYLRSLQRVLKSMHQETLAVFKRDSNESKQTRRTKSPHPASSRRLMQSNTDIQVNRLLHLLQKRVNFHTMWFETTPRQADTARTYKG
ncbi:hypothetical protein P3T76_013871 [Phytophthora citrophthora]|uniref:CST complex subunit CTC1 n=1 Tax=Phytophthora citrophthora TaxID=4793 RepID=A0AAD9LCR0_9STRA|nr:hypothetical protein P3T76_013871 [Phytophthora citrophthora]